MMMILLSWVMQTDSQKINSSILLNAQAEMVEQFDLHSQVAMSRWKIDNNQVNYHKPDSHTLSLYVKGGETSYRADQPINKGAPGKVILMPQNHESDWHINGEIEFVHLYFTDALLKQYAAINFDCDIRSIELQDLTYQEDKQLQQLLFWYFSNQQQSQPSLFSEQSLYAIFHHLIHHYNGFHVNADSIRGGLSAFHIRQIRALIHDCIGEKLTIDRLANEIGLSHFHLAKMFKVSFGESPASFINRVRIEKVKQELHTNREISAISVATGFSQQSHMSQQFKKITGMTPKAYRRLND